MACLPANGRDISLPPSLSFSLLDDSLRHFFIPFIPQSRSPASTRIPCPHTNSGSLTPRMIPCPFFLSHCRNESRKKICPDTRERKLRLCLNLNDRYACPLVSKIGFQAFVEKARHYTIFCRLEPIEFIAARKQWPTNKFVVPKCIPNMSLNLNKASCKESIFWDRDREISHRPSHYEPLL